MDLLSVILKNKVVRLVLAILFLLFVLIWLVGFLATGTLAVKTNDPHNIITISKLDAHGKKLTIKQGQGAVSLRLHSGKYSVSAKNRVFESGQNIEIHARKKASISLDVQVAITIEPVLASGAFDVVADNEKVLFIDTSTGSLYEISGNSAPALVSNSLTFKSARWVGTAFGLVQAADGHLYRFQDGSITPLQVPFTYTEGKEVGYGLTGNDHIYVSSGPNIYSLEGDGTYKEIYVAKSTSPSLVAGKNHLAIIDGGGAVNGDKKSDYGGLLALVDGDGKSVTKTIDSSAVAWSPDDKYLASSSESSSKIYDTSLKETGSYPGGGSTSVAWLDNNTLLYGISGSLWSYNVSAEKAAVIAETPLQGAVSGIYPGIGGSYVYIAVAKTTSSSFELDRINTRGEAVPDYVLQLATNFPKSLSNCQVTYVNFIKPSLLLQGDPGAGQSCLDETKRVLDSDGFDPTKFQLISTPAVTDLPY